MAGRYYQFRLLPLDVKELVEISHADPQKALESSFQLSGFPEPLLSNDVREYRRWRNSHLDIILRQDLLESGSIKSIRSIELLVELMAERVGKLLCIFQGVPLF